MFPTLSSLVNYIFGTDFSWPIPTFGFFVVLAFVLSYQIFRAEFIRKVGTGDIGMIQERVHSDGRRIGLIVIGYGVAGFLLGFKGVGLFVDPVVFLSHPLGWIFSGRGHLVGGILLSVFSMLYMTWSYLRSRKDVDSEEMQTVHPRTLLPKMLLWAAITGFVGAKLLNLVEDYRLLQTHSIGDIWHVSGLTFWGGLLFGAASYLYIGMRKRISWRHLLDIGSLGMLVAYGVGRMGCHLSGDGDWGIVNRLEKPFQAWPDWAWSFHFPYNVIRQGVYIPGCEGAHCYVLPEGVFPTSLYESTVILSIFLVLWFVRGKIRVPGMLFTIYLFVVGTERLLIEFIRVNYKYHVGGILLSEAQLISIGLLLLAVFMVFYLFTKLKTNFKSNKL